MKWLAIMNFMVALGLFIVGMCEPGFDYHILALQFVILGWVIGLYERREKKS